MKKQHCSEKRSRRGVTLVLAAFLMVMMLAMVAFAVDCGYMARGAQPVAGRRGFRSDGGR